MCLPAYLLTSDYSFKGLDYWNKLTETPKPNGFLIYGGIENMQLSKCTIVAWRDIDKIFA